MKSMITRLEWLVGKEHARLMKNKSVAVFGCGGVGSFAVEALVRSGIGRIVVIDGDEVEITNINRQLIALPATIGMRKVEVSKERCLSINPELVFEGLDIVYTHEKYPTLIADLKVDYIIDAIDMVTAKLDLIEQSRAEGIPIISAMGTGNKLDPTRLAVADIAKTHTCPLARVMRRELKKRKILHTDVVFSSEAPRAPQWDDAESSSPGSCAFVPSVAGMTMASYVARKLMEVE